MTYAEFNASLTQHEPNAALPPLLQALWYADRDEWEKAHNIAQAHEGQPHFDWLHALLHRQEGDAPNAAYWYQRAGHAPATHTIRAEWEALVRSQLPG